MNTPVRVRLNCTAIRAICLVTSAVLSTLVGTAKAQLFPTLPATVEFTTATKGGGTNGTPANAPGIKKIAVDAVTGAPLTGPIPAGTTIKYVISYDPPGTGVIFPSVNITDTMSGGLTYVPGSLQMPPGWTSTPVTPFTPPPTTVFNGSQIGSEPGFVLPVNVGGAGTVVTGVGDGFTPVVVGDKVWSFSHHEYNARVNCYEKSTMTLCAPASWNPRAAPSALPTPNGLSTPTFSRYAVHGKRIYHPAFNSGPNQYGIGCYDTDINAPCGGAAVFTPLATYVAGELLTPVGTGPNFYGSNKYIAGVVAATSPSNRIYTNVRDKLYCHVVPAMTACPGFATGGVATLPVTPIASPFPRDVDIDNTAGRIYVHDGNNRVHCLALANGTPCTGWPLVLPAGTQKAWISPTMPSSGIQDGICVSGANYGGATTGVSACFATSGVSVPAKVALLQTAMASVGHGFPYRLPSHPNRVFFSDYVTPAARCVEYSPSGVPTVCPAPFPTSFAAGSGRAGYMDYGYMADPENITCIYGLGHTQRLFRFDATTGASGCASNALWTVPDPKLDFCDGRPHPIAWNAIRIVNRPANLTGGTITVKNGSTVLATMPVTAMNSYSISAIVYASNPNITVVFNPVYSGAPPTTDYSLYVSFTSDVHPQICYKATTSCPAPDGYKNSVTFTQPATAAQQGFTFSDASQLAASCGPVVSGGGDTCCPPLNGNVQTASFFVESEKTPSQPYTNQFGNVVTNSSSTAQLAAKAAVDSWTLAMNAYTNLLKYACGATKLVATFEKFNGDTASPPATVGVPLASFTATFLGSGALIPGGLIAAFNAYSHVSDSRKYIIAATIRAYDAQGKEVKCFDVDACKTGDRFSFHYGFEAAQRVMSPTAGSPKEMVRPSGLVIGQ